jgi:hypothetical protein
MRILTTKYYGIHTDPETIKKIKEHVKDQKIIDDYLNTNRNWI